MNNFTDNRGKKWDNTEVEILIDEYCNKEEDIIYISEILKRTPKSIACKLVHLDRVENKEMTRGYDTCYKQKGVKNRARSKTYNSKNNMNLNVSNNWRRNSSHDDNDTPRMMREMMNKIDRLHNQVEEMKQTINKQ